MPMWAILLMSFGLIAIFLGGLRYHSVKYVWGGQAAPPAPTPAPEAPRPVAARSVALSSVPSLPERAPSILPAPAAPAQPVVIDARSATATALGALPLAAPVMPLASADAIPILYDGARWHTLSLRHSSATGGDYVICGAKRRGKGIAAQLIALQVLSLGPKVAHCWILDPKSGLDYGFALRLRHARLFVGGHTEELRSDGDLTTGYKATLREMYRRNAIMQRVDARNIEEYNARCAPEHRLPYLVVIADEVADLTTDQKADLATLVRMAGASGLVFYILTQYPTVQALSSQVTANAVNRLALGLSSSRHTEVALGLAPGERSTFDPAAISVPGVAVLRREGGQEVLGRVPYVDDTLRQRVIVNLVDRWPRPAFKGSNPVELRSAGSADGNAVERGSDVQALVPEPAQPSGVTNSEPALLAADDLPKLYIALVLYGRNGGKKQPAIEEAFRCKKGGGKVWIQASAAFDQAIKALPAEKESSPAAAPSVPAPASVEQPADQTPALAA